LTEAEKLLAQAERFLLVPKLLLGNANMGQALLGKWSRIDSVDSVDFEQSRALHPEGGPKQELGNQGGLARFRPPPE